LASASLPTLENQVSRVTGRRIARGASCPNEAVEAKATIARPRKGPSFHGRHLAEAGMGRAAPLEPTPRRGEGPAKVGRPRDLT